MKNKMYLLFIAFVIGAVLLIFASEVLHKSEVERIDNADKVKNN